MSAHSIVCRLGDRDRTRLQPAATLIRTEISFIDADRRLDFGLGQALDQLTALGLRPSEVSVDLAVLAATLTAADNRLLTETDGPFTQVDGRQSRPADVAEVLPALAALRGMTPESLRIALLDNLRTLVSH